MLTALYLATLLGFTAEPPRSFRGLRAELNGADAVLRIRVVAIRALDSGWDGSGIPQRQEVDVIVEKVLAGDVVEPGQRLSLAFAARDYREWARDLSGFEVLGGVIERFDMTALVKRAGDRLTLLTLMRAHEGERTDAFFETYARLARLDDSGFTLGLARLLADRVRLAPDRLLWVRWAGLAFDDWDRLKVQLPPTDDRLRHLATEIHRAVLSQVDGFVRAGKGEVNLYELPWLIRLLSRAERRELAAGLLRMHPPLAKDLAAASEAVRLPAVQGTPESDELTMEQMDAMGADAAMAHLIHCLAVCVDPVTPGTHSREDVLRRAREFVR